MALARARRSESGFNYWPGFVDALSTLVLSIVFLLSVFLVVQFFLSQEVTGKDKALEQLNAKIAQLNDLLSLEKLGKLALDDQIAQLRAGLSSAQGERDRIKGLYDGLAGAGSDAQGRANELSKALESEKGVTSRALAQIEVLNQQISALRRQLAALEEALEASEKRDKESQGRIADLGQRLNVALAQRVQELSRYRSEFFGRLRAILGNRPDIRIVGDRFVFQSEVFFDTGQALLLPEGRAELDKLATALIDLDRQIITSCGSGATAATLLLALKLAGAKNVALYDGSWAEWGALAEADTLSMHAVMMTSKPSLLYWAPGTLAVMQAVQAWRRGGLPCYFSIDAGPNVHVFALPEQFQLVGPLGEWVGLFLLGLVGVWMYRVGKRGDQRA